LAEPKSVALIADAVENSAAIAISRKPNSPRNGFAASASA
jgi:hypothetical protein